MMVPATRSGIARAMCQAPRPDLLKPPKMISLRLRALICAIVALQTTSLYQTIDEKRIGCTAASG